MRRPGGRRIPVETTPRDPPAHGRALRPPVPFRTPDPPCATAQDRGHRAEAAPGSDLQGQPFQGGEHLLLRLRQVQADLGLAVDGVPQFSHVARDLRRLITYRHRFLPRRWRNPTVNPVLYCSFALSRLRRCVTAAERGTAS